MSFPFTAVWLTWANALTALRLLLAGPCAWLAGNGRWTAAAWLFSIAIVTDLLDGPAARRFDQASALGGLADHATDALFVTVLLAALSWVSPVPWLLPVLVAAAFLQYVMDSRALAGRALRTSWLGRANGIGYFILAGAVVYRNALDLAWPSAALVEALGWLLVFATATSMLDRARVWLTAE